MKKFFNIQFLVSIFISIILLFCISFLLNKYQKKIFHHHYYVDIIKEIPEVVSITLNLSLENEMKKNPILRKILLIEKYEVIVNEKMLLTGKDGYFYRVLSEKNLKDFENEMKQSGIIENTKKKLISSYNEDRLRRIVSLTKTIEFLENINCNEDIKKKKEDRFRIIKSLKELNNINSNIKKKLINIYEDRNLNILCEDFFLAENDIRLYVSQINTLSLYIDSLKNQLGKFDTITLSYKKVMMRKEFKYYFNALLGIYILIMLFFIFFKKIYKY